MDCDLLALVEQDGFRAVRESTSRGGQLNGPCPFCGGVDRFRVQANYGRYGWFACSQCERRGSSIDYLMLKRGLSKVEALHAVGWQPVDGSTLHAVIPKYAEDERPQWDEPPEIWQDAARDFYQACHRALWGTEGKSALAYLQRRGLTEQTIKAAMLGYHPREAYGLAREWGKPVKLPQGIVIPWFIERKVWRITIRDEPVVEEEKGRYKQVGGGSNGLYLADSLRLKRQAVVMVEGEFDALSLAQECGSLVSVVATGTTQGSHTPRWLAALASAPRVMVAFDAEEKGDRAAGWWLSRLENAVRLRPWWSDANQMLQDGADLRAWMSEGTGLTQKGLYSTQAHGSYGASPQNEANPQPADLQPEHFGAQTRSGDPHLAFEEGVHQADTLNTAPTHGATTPELLYLDAQGLLPYWDELDQGVVDEMEREYAQQCDLFRRYHLQETFIPCPKCRCGVYRDLEGSQVCCRCYPPKGYHQYQALIDQLYPRKRSF